MTVFSPDPLARQEVGPLRELHHKVTHGIASAINLVSAAAVRAECAETKAALGGVVELLHGYADVHRALAMPAGETLIHAATYIRKVGCALRRAQLDQMNIQLAFATQSLALQPERCWRLGLIVHELVTNAARQACFDARPGQIKVKLTRIGALVNCVIEDNGSRSARGASDREFRISKELARVLGGRIEQGFGTEFTSVGLSFPLTERERQVNWTMATRQMKPPHGTRAVVSDDTTLAVRAVVVDRRRPVSSESNRKFSRQYESELDVPRQAPDALGELLSPYPRTVAP
jgi:two-component sensor histidine kinase